MCLYVPLPRFLYSSVPGERALVRASDEAIQSSLMILPQYIAHIAYLYAYIHINTCKCRER